jgi:lysyl-tRNA synthetase class 2
MSNWRPTSGPDAARRRAAMLTRLRKYFASEIVLEVDTPALSAAAASDIQIESLEVRSGLRASPLYLHTSPEFFMKRLLAAGFPDIYSICRVYRDGEVGRNHQPEFTMAEWYRLGFSLSEIVADTVAAIASALDDPNLESEFDVVNYKDAFNLAAAVDPIESTIDELASAANADDSLRQTLGDERNDWLDLLLSTKVAATFSGERLTVLQHYPVAQAALARACPDDGSVADRFEIFMGPMELANGYVELTDAATQAARIDSDQAARKKRGLPIRPTDNALLAALTAGLPMCAGVAMGVERLQMMHDKTDDIRSVVPFGFENC